MPLQRQRQDLTGCPNLPEKGLQDKSWIGPIYPSPSQPIFSVVCTQHCVMTLKRLQGRLDLSLTFWHQLSLTFSHLVKYVFLDAYIGTASCTGYSGTPPYGHLLITATFFCHPAKTTIHFLLKKSSLMRSPKPCGRSCRALDLLRSACPTRPLGPRTLRSSLNKSEYFLPRRLT